MKKIQVEFLYHHYGAVSVYIDGVNEFDTGRSLVRDILESVSESIYKRYAEGDTIFYLTPKQLEKLRTRLNKKPGN